jgi:tetratricopeptide (TPR) repeat protein
VELNSSDADGHYLLGSLLLHIRRSEEAVEHLQRAIELRPGFYAAEKRLADAKSTLRLP